MTSGRPETIKLTLPTAEEQAYLDSVQQRIKPADPTQIIGGPKFARYCDRSGGLCYAPECKERCVAALPQAATPAEQEKG